MLYNGDNEIIQVYKGANLLDSAHSSSTKVWPTALPTEPTITVNPGGTSVQVSAGKYKDAMGREFEFDTPRTLYLNPEGPVPAGSGIVSIPTEYSNWNSPANKKAYIGLYDSYASHYWINQDATGAIFKIDYLSGNNQLVDGNLSTFGQIAIGSDWSSPTALQVNNIRATKALTEDKIYRISFSATVNYGKTYHEIHKGYFNQTWTMYLTRNGEEVDTDEQQLTTAQVLNGSSKTFRVSATLGFSAGTTPTLGVGFRIQPQAGADYRDYIGVRIDYWRCTEAFTPGYLDGCYNMGMYYDEYSDNMYLYNMTVTEGTKFGVACVQSGVISSWSKS